VWTRSVLSSAAEIARGDGQSADRSERAAAEREALSSWRWRGRTVKLVDGGTISMPDRPQNQGCYPQPSSQALGVGLPLARILAVICLSTGAVREAATGPCEGAGNSELGYRAPGRCVHPGDVMLADSFYCNCVIIATLQAAGIDSVFEQHGGRITDFRRGRQLGTCSAPSIRSALD